MAEIYARYVRAGEKTLDDVPPRWRAQVAQLLGWVTASGTEESEG